MTPSSAALVSDWRPTSTASRRSSICWLRRAIAWSRLRAGQPTRPCSVLLAATGLRVSEAVHLMDADVDLKSGILTVRQTKFAKSRQVPLHPSTESRCCSSIGGYATAISRSRTRRRSSSARAVSVAGVLWALRQVHRVFQQLRVQLGWVNRGAHANPRIHDLRHTFIVRRVLLWHAQGVDIDQAMLSLSTYVGHAMVTNTYWYLTGVPELMALAAGQFESLHAGRRRCPMPEVAAERSPYVPHTGPAVLHRVSGQPARHESQYRHQLPRCLAMLFLDFAHEYLGKAPTELHLTDIEARRDSGIPR